MAEAARRVVRKLTAARPVRYVMGTVLTVDEDGCEVDLGEGATVDAVVSSLVGSVAVDQGVRMSVQGNTYVVESVTSDESNNGDSFLAETGWMVTQFVMRRVGRMVAFNSIFTRTGSAVSVPSNGNIVNQTILTITDPAYLPVVGTALAHYHTGQMAAYTVATAGELWMTAVPPGVTITTGDQFSAAGTWIAT